MSGPEDLKFKLPEDMLWHAKDKKLWLTVNIYAMEMKLTVAHSRLPSLLQQSVENGNWQRERETKRKTIFFSHIFIAQRVTSNSSQVLIITLREII